MAGQFIGRGAGLGALGVGVKSVRGLLAGLTAASLVTLAGTPASGAATSPTAIDSAARPIASVKVAEIEIRGKVSEKKAPASPFATKTRPTLSELIAGLDTIAKRDDLRGVLIRLREPVMNMAQVEELGAAMKRVRDAGKKVSLYSYGYGTPEMVLGSFADEVIAQQGGGAMLPGVYAEEMYLADMFNWVGAKADFVQVGDYKGASEMFANAKPSKEWDQNINGLLDGMYGNVRRHIMTGRKLDDAGLDKAMAATWLATVEDAKKAGLVDAIVDLPAITDHFQRTMNSKDVAWVDDVLPGAKDKKGPPNFFELFSTLMEGPKERKVTRPTIAVLHIDGAIIDGDSTSGNPILGGETSVGSLTIRRALAKIEEEDLVKGVVIRINSPGGSAIASEVMWQGIRRVADKGKPVFVSVGSMAASGGYYLAVAGDKIYVNPSSIVGSIGVVGGKFVMGGVYDKLKINITPRARGPRADMMSTLKPWNDEQKAYVREKMTDTYKLFTSRVTAGRKGIDLAKTAEGRLFTGQQAIDLKMADKIGGLTVAIDDLAKQLNLPAGQFDVFDYPGPKSLDEMLEDLFGTMASARVSTGPISELAVIGREVLGEQAFGQVVDHLSAIRQLRREPVLLTTPRVIIFR